ncbi:MAG: HAD-IA family hydrolase [Chloroflexota bacterium]
MGEEWVFFDLADGFDLILTSARVGYRKPRPEIFRFALELAGVEPGRALYVGDDPVCDRDGARAVGMPCLLVDRAKVASPRRRRIQRLDQILDFL